MTSKYKILAIIIILIIYLPIHVYQARKSAYDDRQLELDPILAYTEQVSYTTGDEVPIYVHTTAPAKGIIYHITDTFENTGINYMIEPTLQSSTYNPLRGLLWKETISLKTDELESGYYILRIKQTKEPEEEYNLPFLIKPKQHKKIAIISSTNTWQAYNHFGGKCNYSDSVSPWYLKLIYKYFPHTDPIHYLPFARPYAFPEKMFENYKGITTTIEKFDYANTVKDFAHADIGSHLVKGELNLIGFLHENKYEFGVYADHDFAHSGLPNDADLIIFHVHCEYWSQEMMGRLQQFVKKGGKVIFASGNNIYREIQDYEWGIKVIDQFIDSSIATKLTGAFYTPITYLKAAGYQVQKPDHWVFTGTGSQEGNIFGEIGASGNETDKIGFGSTDYIVLAIGTNTAGPAYMIIKEDKNGSWLFNASSTMFTKCLRRDKVADQIMRNLINRALE